MQSIPSQHVTITLHHLISSFQQDATQCKGHKSSTVSHSPSLISLSIYKRLFPLLWAVSVTFQLPQDSSLIQFPRTAHRLKKQQKITKPKKNTKIILEGIFQVSLLANGQPRECAYKLKSALIYIHQALRTRGQRNPSQVYQDMEIYIIIYIYKTSLLLHIYTF